MTAPPRRVRARSKTLASWIALLGGSLGLHRFYLHGWRDRLGWLHVPPTLAGLYGVQRMRSLGQDDALAALLVPALGVSISAAMLAAIVYGLTDAAAWHARFGAEGRRGAGGWLAVCAVVLALGVGASVLLATIAFASQRWFEHQASREAAAVAPAR